MWIVFGVTLHFALVQLQLILFNVVLAKTLDNKLLCSFLVLFNFFISIYERQTEIGNVNTIKSCFQNGESLTLRQDHQDPLKSFYQIFILIVLIHKRDSQLYEMG